MANGMIGGKRSKVRSTVEKMKPIDAVKNEGNCRTATACTLFIARNADINSWIYKVRYMDVRVLFRHHKNSW